MISTYIIHKKKLTPEEIELLIEEVRKTPNIIGATRKELSLYNDVWIAEVDNKFVGVCVSIDISSRWTKLALLYVLKQFRGKGIGKDLFLTALSDIKKRKRNVYTSSKSPAVISFMKKQNMKIHRTIFTLPFPVQLFNLRFILNPYRIKEFIRKSIVYKNSGSYVYGLKYHKLSS